MANTWNSDGSPGSVQALHNQAATVDGDIITIPAGTFTNWTSGVTVTKNVAIKGLTTVDKANRTSNDLTVLVDNLPRVPGGQCFFNLNTNGGTATPRISGIKFTGNGGVQGNYMYNGICCRINGTKPVRIDNCVFENIWGSPTNQVNAANFGVIDHCWMKCTLVSEITSGIAHVYMATYGGKTLGDGAWEQPAGWGGPNFFFIEDCFDSGFSYYGCGADSSLGAKIVFRHNENRGAQVGSHGTARHSQTNRGSRALEVYQNLYHMDLQNHSPQGNDGGSVLYWGNRYTGSVTTGIQLNYYRSAYSYAAPFHGANGTNAWDIAATELDGTHVDGHPNFVFASGTISSYTGSGLVGTITVSGSPGWGINHWIGYTAAQVGGEPTGLIKSNTANSLTVQYSNAQMTFSGGATVQVYLMVRCLDQPGAGMTDPMNRNIPAWLNQQFEPCYCWDNPNPVTGQQIQFSIGATGGQTILEGRDYINSQLPGYTPYTYPHPLTGGVAPANKNITLAGPGLAFGSVALGQAPTATLTVTNNGDTLLTVTAVAYPAAFTGATGGFTLAASASRNITVTFTPLLAQAYSGTITVSSDATTGSGTIACSGIGVAAIPPIHGHRKQARDAFQF